MTELTKEQLIEEAKLKIAIAKCHTNSGMARVEGELFKIALASLEAEPVAECIVEDGGMCIDGFGEYVGHSLPDGTHQLYTAPPAPNGMQAHGIEIAINELVALSPRLDKRAVETLSMAVEHLRKLVKKQLQTKD
ncbi:hypothetical protein [Escherichia coli]|uniref:hypothetical protein n=1 Tax=Escherichia coli TaxID=562 RepID=UPI0010CAE8DF|nr:hypothetical protein [Escherichia coli]EFH7719306.1 hypothetical protein [Escherichia coli]EFH8090526.1 hypothetical protein [Escherichia coli]EHS6045717.1 hypothetical protein [Escherichia coli]EKU4848406.1 hypothetical protein [Escherichia coli]MBK1764752.1 hypothetical protein [Escherichia coli]